MPLPSLSSAVAEAHHSGIREIANQAMLMPGAIRLEAGQPDFRTPDHISEAAKRAIDDGHTYYTHTAGIPPLREALVDKLRAVNHIEAGTDRVTIGPGGVGVIAAAIGALCNPGDEVLLPDPHWPNYTIMLSWSQTRGVFYPCPARLGYQPDLERLEALLTPRSKVLVVNSPNNPTGAVYPAETMHELGEIAARNNLWLISDESYDQIMLDGSAVAVSMAGQADPERTISVFTFSKTYAMTGWRVGYAVASRPVIDLMTKVLESNSSCVSTVSQHAALAALTGPQDCVQEMVGAYRRRRDLVCDILREPGLLGAVPDGAFYVMADVAPSGMNSRDFALRLLRERRVGVAPGTAFGTVASDAVRISLASSDAHLREGVGHLCELVSQTRD